MGALIWLSSYPKSGNTWLRTFLHHLFLDPPQPLPPNALNRFTLGDSDRIWFDAVAGGQTVDFTEEQLAALHPAAQARMTQAFPDSVFVKTHSFLGQWYGVPLINFEVTAGTIYVVRDPRDIVISGAHHYGVSIDEMINRMENPEATTGGTQVHVPILMSTWSEHVDSWTRHSHRQLHVVRYEDMEKKPLGTFGGIARFLGLSPPKDRLERAIRFSSFKVVQNLEGQHGFQERSEFSDRFFRVGKSGQWRKGLTPEQVARIETVHRDVMIRFGYLKAP